MKKDYYVQEKDSKLIVNTAYKEGNQYVQHVRNGRSYDKLLDELSKVYTIDRYYRRNKNVPGLRHMVVKVKNVDKMYYEDFFCDEMVNSANPLTSPKNFKQIQSRQYILQKKLKDVIK